jgi:NAD-dependent deacetylase sirtuin 4
MEREGKLHSVITQNVDFLHGKAGTKNLIELHGNGFKVICIGKPGAAKEGGKCDYSIPRHEFQNILTQLNQPLYEKANSLVNSSEQRPDGDIDISQEDIENFFLPGELEGGGVEY